MIIHHQNNILQKTDNTGIFQQQMAIYSYANDEWVFKTGSAEVESLTIKNDGWYWKHY